MMVIYKENGIYYATNKENYEAEIRNAREIHKMEGFNSAEEIIEYFCKFCGSKAEDFIIKGKVYLTHYTEYPIYEPAEGGYYYAGREADTSWECDTLEEAQKQLAEMKEELEADGFIVREDLTKATLDSKYIGDGEMWVIEETYGSHNSGRQIYQ